MRARRFVPAVVAVLLAGCAGAAQDRATPLSVDLRSVTPGATTQPRPDLRSGTPSPAPPAAAGWDRIELDGTVRSLHSMGGYVLVAGDRNGWPLLARVRNGLAATDLGEQLDMQGRLDWVDSDGEDVAVTAQPGTGPPDAWSGQYSPTDVRGLERTPVKDAAGRTPGWVRPLFDGEEDYRLVGAVSVGGRWELHAWSEWPDGMLPLDRGGLTVPDPARVLFGNTESIVVVAGPLTDALGPGRGRAVWWADDVGYTGETPRWRRQDLPAPVDDLTDVTCWVAGCWAAGHRKRAPGGVPRGRRRVRRRAGHHARPPPSHGGPRRPPGRQAAGARHPEPRRHRPLGGPQEREMDAHPRPRRGRLTDAVRVDDGFYVLAEGTLWFRPLA